MGVDGSQVWTLYQEGRVAEIRDYCETDVVNTYLVYCRYQLMRGQLTRAAFDAEIDLVRRSLAEVDAPHWKEYLAAWPAAQDKQAAPLTEDDIDVTTSSFFTDRDEQVTAEQQKTESFQEMWEQPQVELSRRARRRLGKSAQ
jgi:hypothetical protein